MQFPKRYFVLFSLTMAVAFLTASCSDKISQCNKIIKIANDAVSQAKTVTNGGQASDPKSMLQAAEAMEKASKQMTDIPVNDPKLKDYQTGFVKMYGDTSKATRDFVKAFEKKDRSAAERALTSLQQATLPEKQLVTDINTYCSGK
ncbi:MAG: hypothetical protein WA828_06645 [Coleofasciculaceae cyanobacterium]